MKTPTELLLSDEATLILLDAAIAECQTGESHAALTAVRMKVAALLEAQEKDAQDARRYRWLRKHHTYYWGMQKDALREDIIDAALASAGKETP